MRKRNKRIISIVLILALLFTLVPMSSLAEEIGAPIDSSGPPEISKQKSEGKIIGEVIDKREKNVKHFLKYPQGLTFLK